MHQLIPLFPAWTKWFACNLACTIDPQLEFDELPILAHGLLYRAGQRPHGRRYPFGNGNRKAVTHLDADHGI